MEKQQLAKYSEWLQSHSSLPDKASLEDYGEDTASLIQQYGVLLEYETMQDLMPRGMYVLPSFDSIFTWQGVVFVQQGLYKGGVFKFQLQLPEDYPARGPELRFVSEVFHPMVDAKTGRLDLVSLFPEWRPGRDFAAYVLPHVHRVFLRREYFASSSSRPSLNEEAKQLYLSDPATFAERARACASSSLQRVHEEDFRPSGSSALQFARSGPDEAHEAIIEQFKATSDQSLPVEERKKIFVDWFCDRYVNTCTLDADMQVSI
eukprot:TRINITY_DN25963_c0_g1_i1.p1 TRINITY_DN25963_c0_g1~~TRINITY_DN25963_c0_g1_i1.p1  ORF type:complete len:273 (-),score=68.64 TRINITY_DN25963_c0_g1_i1:61-846(-)